VAFQYAGGDGPLQHARAGITPRVRTHDLRYTFATQPGAVVFRIETIQELLGHADIAETPDLRALHQRAKLSAVST
jgi:site-specific recombinase XerD